METIFSIRENLEKIYEKYDTYVLSLGKFLTAFFIFLQINMRIGYMEKLDSFVIVLILALACSFLPWNAVILFAAAMILAHLYALSLPALVVGGGILLMLMLLYFGLAPGESLALIFTVGALTLHIPCAVPLAFGLLAGPVSAVGIITGTIGYYTIRAVSGTASASVGMTGTAAEETADLVGQMGKMVQAVIQEKEMILMLIALTATLVLVYVIRRMTMKHAWGIGIAAGTAAFLIVMVFGSISLGVSGVIFITLLGTALSVLIAVLLQLFFFNLDFRHTQSVQFEDDEYYYYVKAVPKRGKGRERHGEH